MDWLNLIFYTLVNILPLVVLALLPFRDSLRLKPGWIALLTAVVCAVNAVASWCAMHGASAAWLSVLSIFFYLGFYLAAVRAGPLKLLAVLLVIMNFASLASVTAYFLMLALSPELVTQLYTWGYIGLYALGLLLPFPFYYRMLDKRIRPQVTAGNAEPFWPMGSPRHLLRGVLLRAVFQRRGERVRKLLEERAVSVVYQHWVLAGHKPDCSVPGRGPGNGQLNTGRQDIRWRKV